MRKPKGKVVAVLAGAAVVLLVAVGAVFWKDIYCHLFLDPRLVGRWRSHEYGVPHLLEFDRLGNYVLDFAGMGRPGTYRIERSTLVFTPAEEGADEVAHEYSIAAGSLSLRGPPHCAYRRVPDDS